MAEPDSRSRLSRRALLGRGGGLALGAAGLAFVGCGHEEAEPPATAAADEADQAQPGVEEPAPAPAEDQQADAQDGDEEAAVADTDDQSDPESVAEPPARRRLMPERDCDACTLDDPAFEPLAGSHAFFGIADGAAYRIEIPDNWNGTLILWGRGFGGLNDAGSDFESHLGFGGMPPAREVLVPAGVGWGASTYAAAGYVPARGVDDLLTVKEIAIAEVGEPERTYCAGASMGGATAQLMAQEYPDQIDGALALCGALSNAEVVDFLVGWHALAHWLIGAPPEESHASGLLEWGSALGRVEDGVLRLTEAGERFALLIEDLSGGARWAFRDGLAGNWQINFGLGAAYWPTILQAEISPGAVIEHDAALTAFDTQDVLYRAPAASEIDQDRLNAEVLRFRSPAELRTDAALGVASGRLDVPLITLKTTGDLWTPLSLDRAYARRVDAAGNRDNLVQRVVRRAGHCNFSEIDEGLRGLLDLTRWVTEGVRPQGEDLIRDDLSGAGVDFTDPFDEDDPLAPSVRARFGRALSWV